MAKKANKKKDPYLIGIGAKIVLLRNKKDIIQEELAHAVGTSSTQIRRIEHGQSNFTIDTLRRISTVLGVSASELIRIE
jgi:transcriptional regulator with XRE-family HTH domain